MLNSEARLFVQDNGEFFEMKGSSKYVPVKLVYQENSGTYMELVGTEFKSVHPDSYVWNLDE